MEFNVLENMLGTDEAMAEITAMSTEEYKQLLADFHAQRAQDEQRKNEMAEKMRRLRVTGLEKQLAAAEADYRAADDIEALAGGDDSAYLAPDELRSATARRDFVRENLAELGPDELLAQVKRVAGSRDKALQYLYRRYAPARFEAFELANLPLHVKRDFDAAMEEIAAAILPEDVRTAPQRAHQQRLEANQRVADIKQRLRGNGWQGDPNPFSHMRKGR